MSNQNEPATDPTSQAGAPRVSRRDVELIVQGRHDDPFAILGPHQVAEHEWEIRAFIPGADRIDVLDARGPDQFASMERIHDSGFFIVSLTSEYRPWYRLRYESREGVYSRYDPYSFLPILSHEEIALTRQVGSDGVYRILGAHPRLVGETEGFLFAVWAPNARHVSLVGEFNTWDTRAHPMRSRHDGGIWELFVPDFDAGSRYKFQIIGPGGEALPQRSDPLAFAAEHPPETASIARGLPEPAWSDGEWMEARAKHDPRKMPMSIYECHLGSWARVPEEGDRFLTYDEFGDRLISYVAELGFTHIELLPITEFPFDGSWGYQPVSLFAPTSRFGTAEQFAGFVDKAHQAGIGIILDWVPGHFPNDPHGLGEFDGTHLYEHSDPRQGFHQDWGTLIYNFGREEVKAFLVANARFWLETFHLDGLRVDAVASMLYLDYSRKAGEWVPNRFGGNENIEAIDFLRKMNETVYGTHPGIVTIAEESTAWPGVSSPTYTGGLGFGFKWNMGWMHDTLRFIGKDTVYRRFHHSDLTFGLIYAFSENFVLPLSHDEVVHGKGSLLSRMPGDRWQKFANLRAYFAFMWGHPGKKLLFMGGEFGQQDEWNHDRSLDWHLLDDPYHKGVQNLIKDLNHFYRHTPALYERDTDAGGFQWLVSDDADNSVVAWLRRGDRDDQIVLVVSNFTPVPREAYRLGVPAAGFYVEAINTDAGGYGGSNVGNLGGVEADTIRSHGHDHSISITLPPLGTVFFVLNR
jgi:1,4-alpha-glucan branching enzyme